jgi:hypothetical protein
MFRTGVSAITPVMWARSRTSGALHLATRTSATPAAARHAAEIAAFATGYSRIREAANSVGSVATSPRAVTTGVETESRSHPRRNDPTDRASVTARITADPSVPPTTETVTRLQIDTDGWPNADETTRAGTASQTDESAS